MKRKSCAFTGHRPEKFPWKYDEEADDCVKLKSALKNQIARLVNDGYTDFFSGMAQGTDTWAATVRYAQKMDRDILILDPYTREVTSGRTPD